MRRPTHTQIARWLAFCEFQLTLDDLSPERRSLLEQKAAVYRRQMQGRCRRCGRSLKDETATVGPECATKTAVA